MPGIRPPAGQALREHPVPAVAGRVPVRASPGGLPVVRAARGAGAVGGGQEPADEVVRLVPGAVGEAAAVEQGGRDFRLRL